MSSWRVGAYLGQNGGGRRLVPGPGVALTRAGLGRRGAGLADPRPIQRLSSCGRLPYIRASRTAAATRSARNRLRRPDRKYADNACARILSQLPVPQGVESRPAASPRPPALRARPRPTRRRIEHQPRAAGAVSPWAGRRHGNEPERRWRSAPRPPKTFTPRLGVTPGPLVRDATGLAARRRSHEAAHTLREPQRAGPAWSCAAR